MTPLRVLFVNENIGGHATVHHHLERVLAERDDVACTFLHVLPPGPLRRVAGAAIPGLARLDADLQPLRAQLALSAWVARRLRAATRDVDAVHLYTHNAGLLSWRLLEKMPLVVTLDTTNARNAYRLPYRRPTALTPATVALTKPFERRVHRAADFVVANSGWAADSLVEDYGVDGERLRVLPFGIEAPAFDPAAAPGTVRSGRPGGKPSVVFVGRQLERKGGLQLLRLHQAHLRDVAELVLVTTEPVEPAPGVRVIDDLRPGDPRLWDVLRAGSVFAFPSEIDQAPNAVLEAMAAGLPVVAARSGAVPEMVEEGVTGFLVEPRDDRSLLEAMQRLLADPGLRRSMGEAGSRRRAELFDLRRNASVLVELLHLAAGRHGGATGGPGVPAGSRLLPEGNRWGG